MNKVENVYIVGSGYMGSGIAQVSAAAGYKVKLYDVSAEKSQKAIDNISFWLNKKVEKNKMTLEEKDAIMAKLSTSTNLKDASEADLVIEAVFEKKELKQEILSKVSKYTKDNSIIATNTSSISITSLGTAVQKPENFIGMHFFSPVPAMKLLEVIPGLYTSGETLETAKQIGESLGKVVITAKDTPGFIVNRLLDPMANEACFLIEEGVSPEDIDKGMRYGLNHPMGICELMDEAGFDTLLDVMNVFIEATGDQKYRPAPLLKKVVETGRCGRKSGAGWYDYDKDGNRIPRKW